MRDMIFSDGTALGQPILPESSYPLGSPRQELLREATACAVDDIRRLIRAGSRARTEVRVNAASAARWLLSRQGWTALHAAGIPDQGRVIGAAMARRALSVLGMSEDDVRADDDAAWATAVDEGRWPPKADRTLAASPDTFQLVA